MLSVPGAKTVPNVSEVASIGGMVRQYQIVLDPDRMRAYNIPHGKIIEAVQKANQKAGGSVLELGEAEYMVRASGYLQSLDDFRKIPLTTTDAGVSVRLGDVVRVQVGPEMRRGIAELSGEGEVAGGIIVMRYQGVNANIMSLGGIAIAIGAMVDAAVVMIENAHKKLEAWRHQHPDQELAGEARWQVIGDAAAEVGPALFFSLLIITLSFIPVFTLEAQEGRLFSPLAFTKTYAMAAAAGLSVTLVPVLMGYLIRGHIPDEHKNPLNRALIALYRPLLEMVLRFPWTTLTMALVIAMASLWPISQLGGEFMPPLDEGDVLYMPSALPGISAGKVSELLQQTDRLIKTAPEVQSVFGKAGRAETATDPAPLEMFETTVQFKPRDQWRPGMTPDKLIEELDRIVTV